jgi:hypothetical protein
VDLLQIIGIAVVWLTFSTLVVAVAAAAGRADSRHLRPDAAAATRARQGLTEREPSRIKASRAPGAQRTASDHRVRPGMPAATR